ncbi:MAG TPA: pitrilysin family protein [Pyrinomonadaceae bacterium]|nr:pitrilysin family protein [Pyrinomonadaceae bacterium]
MKEQISETRLPGGPVVLTDRMPGVRSATLGFFFRVGARHEPIELHGITHFIEHCVFKGTSRRSALDIAIEQERLGGNLDAFTTHEETGFAIKVIDDQLSAAFDLLADMLLDPTFAEDELLSEQKVIIEEMKMVEDSPEDVFGDLFNAEFFAGDPLGRNIAGTAETVRTFDHGRTREYHAAAFLPENLVIAAAGNVEHAALLGLIQSAGFGASARDGENKLKLKLTTPVASAPIVVKQRPDLEQAHLVLATPFPDARDPRRYAADLTASVLGGGTASRLWQKVREERGLAYNVGASTTMYDNVGVFSVFAATSPEQVREVVEISVEEMRNVIRDGVTPDELDLAKAQARTSVLLSLEDSASRAAALAQAEMVHGRQISVEETLAGIEAVTLEECQTLAREFFRTESVMFAAMGDLAELAVERGDLTVS